MPEVKITYFPIEAVAEPLRLTMVCAGIDFTDCRVVGDAWDALKPKTKYGQMPFMEVDGKQMYQSDALLRYIATVLDPSSSLYPQDLHFEVDEALGVIADFDKGFMPAHYMGMRPESLGHHIEGDAKAAKVQQMREKWVADGLPKMLDQLISVIDGNGGGPFLCGKTMTIADIALLRRLRMQTGGFVDHVPATCLQTHPRIVQYMENLMVVPKIAEWYAQEKRGPGEHKVVGGKYQ